ncbi:DUF7269 family protein [Natronorubrum sp. FCH18a]|uniref:DUF7269 family protein n=1 Tax=Natronorubrum sp. FCH18a TaxID=3447018 RepID=UPI003F514680
MSRTPSTTGLALVTLLGAILVAVGGVLAFRPALLLERVPELRPLLERVDPGLLVLALVVLFVLFAPAIGIGGRFRPSSTTPLVGDESPDRTESRDDDRPGGRPSRQSVVGAAADERIGLATAYDDEPRDSREGAREALLESLRPIAATAYANRAGIADHDAMAAIEAGTWTDDPRAAAFLAGADGPSTPLWLWLIDLVSAADPFERSLERTLDEIETLQSAATVAGPPVRETDSTEDELPDGVTA